LGVAITTVQRKRPRVFGTGGGGLGGPVPAGYLAGGGEKKGYRGGGGEGGGNLDPRACLERKKGGAAHHLFGRRGTGGSGGARPFGFPVPIPGGEEQEGLRRLLALGVQGKEVKTGEKVCAPFLCKVGWGGGKTQRGGPR